MFYAGADGTDAPVGFAVLTAPEFPFAPEPGDVELRRIYTLAPLHGQGLGPALLAASLADARARGCRRMLLGTHPGNRRAQRFYERAGFAVIARRRFQVGTQQFDDPVYALAL